MASNPESNSSSSRSADNSTEPTQTAAAAARIAKNDYFLEIQNI
jgi:hypothetical protein